MTAHGCGTKTIEILQVVSVSNSDEVAREELVVWFLAGDYRNVTAPPVLVNESRPTLL